MPETGENPYAPTAQEPRAGRPRSAELVEPGASLPRTVVRWVFVCSISAAPSFLWGWSTIAQEQAAAMITGVAIFIVAYVAGDRLTRNRLWRRRRLVRRTLMIGYLTRCALSVLYPAGMYLDLWVGLVAIMFVEWVLPDGIVATQQEGFGVVLIVTLVQGALLNVALLAYMGVVLGVQMVVRAVRDRPID